MKYWLFVESTQDSEVQEFYKTFLIDIHMWNIQLGEFKCDQPSAKNFKQTELWAWNSGGIHGMTALHQKTGN
jgi:hypothetical protein